MAIKPMKIVNIPSGINKGLSSPSNTTMLSILGMPRNTIDSKCRGATNEPMKSLVVTENVGPFKVTGIKPAVSSLAKVLAKVKTDFPEVYNIMGSSGMLCVRLIGKSTKISNHAWGCALDINLSGALDGIGVGGGTKKLDGKTLAGLAAIAPLFNAEGWYWGVGFSSFEDGMHFEIADETIRKWKEDGTLGAVVSEHSTAPASLTRGDRGASVRNLQKSLAKAGYDIIADGEFGPITHGIVIDFQTKNGLVPDGVVGPKTLAKLPKP
ncbi:MAG: peptidoglycan-binding protein [Paracoccaceae bacterium]|jgi:hypothetical protein